MSAARLRHELLDIYHHAVDAVKPERLVRNAIRFQTEQDNPDKISLIVKRHSRADNLRIDLKDTRIHVIGGGKSVLGMARGLAQVASESGLTSRFAGGVLSLPSGSESCNRSVNDLNLQLFYGSKDNLPDGDSLVASQAILDHIEACKSDSKPLFVVLISGGGSACLASPRYIGLDQKLDLIKGLVRKGANIKDLNKVRRYFSYIKAGNLARHIFRHNNNAQIVTLIISDVIGDSVEFIASGPTHIDDTDDGYLQMSRVLEKYQIQVPKLPATNDRGGNSDCGHVFNCIIGNNKVAIEAAAKRAEAHDFQVIDMGGELCGSTEFVMRSLIARGRLARERSPIGKLLVIGGGEATVKLGEGQTWGVGGRAQEMALDYLMEDTEMRDGDIDLFLAAGTDGQDGPTDVAGCLASRGESYIALEKVRRAKERHDSYHFWQRERPDWLIRTGLTGTNVMDLYMYALDDKF